MHHVPFGYVKNTISTSFWHSKNFCRVQHSVFSSFAHCCLPRSPNTLSQSNKKKINYQQSANDEVCNAHSNRQKFLWPSELYFALLRRITELKKNYWLHLPYTLAMPQRCLCHRHPAVFEIRWLPPPCCTYGVPTFVHGTGNLLSDASQQCLFQKKKNTTRGTDDLRI